MDQIKECYAGRKKEEIDVRFPVANVNILTNQISFLVISLRAFSSLKASSG